MIPPKWKVRWFVLSFSTGNKAEIGVRVRRHRWKSQRVVRPRDVTASQELSFLSRFGCPANAYRWRLARRVNDRWKRMARPSSLDSLYRRRV